MQSRLDFTKIDPAAYRAMLGLEAYVRSSNLPPGLDAWRETPFYNDRERAALAWTEALTLIRGTHAPDDVYAEVSRHFAADDLVAGGTPTARARAPSLAGPLLATLAQSPMADVRGRAHSFCW